MISSIRIGVSAPGGRIVRELQDRGIPGLISANALFDHRTGGFRPVPWQLVDWDVALDSAGFMAMRHYGRYPWTMTQYLMLAESPVWAWWSQMDYCCEPEIARDRREVRRRVDATASSLWDLREEVRRWNDRGFRQIPDPVPVLQGWLPDDYRRSAELAHTALRGRWPAMLGVGSVCRRSLGGPDGLWRILATLDEILPREITLHLFGVKGPALDQLARLDREFSVDSMAFELKAHMDARKRGQSKTIDLRLEALDAWWRQQQRRAWLNPQHELQLIA